MAAFAARRVRESGSSVSQGDDTSAISATERQGGTGVAALCVSSADVHRLLMLCATASNAAESSLNVHTIQSSIVIASAGATGRKTSGAQTARNAGCRLFRRKVSTAPTAAGRVLASQKWAALTAERKQQSAKGRI